jgi:hypothetical protein
MWDWGWRGLRNEECRRRSRAETATAMASTSSLAELAARNGSCATRSPASGRTRGSAAIPLSGSRTLVSGVSEARWDDLKAMGFETPKGAYQGQSSFAAHGQMSGFIAALRARKAPAALALEIGRSGMCRHPGRRLSEGPKLRQEIPEEHFRNRSPKVDRRNTVPINSYCAGIQRLIGDKPH